MMQLFQSKYLAQAFPILALAFFTIGCSADESAEMQPKTERTQYAESDTNLVLESSLEVYNIETGERRVVYRVQDHIEAPNWSRDGTYFLYNSHGNLYTLPVDGGTPTQLNTGFADNCNNDHGFSPDGTEIALSHSPEGKGSIIYIMPAEGGTPRQVTENWPSWWHGWSPDGQTLVYPGGRDGEIDIYAIPAAGGEETRLTTAPGLDDGADYSPDGEWIYFNSVRTGVMKIFRMRPDGSDIQQMTSNEQYGDWFPHPSPDGEHVVFLSYDASVEGHPRDKDVVLRIMPLEGGEPEVIVELFGGQGTINVPSWSPDSKEFAFVSYDYVKP
jgi:Tol biopolymer transport system component